MASRPLEENGIHRAKLWEIGFYALNNTSTNVYMMLVSSISYFLIGMVGIGVVLAGSIVTIMRIWDGVTDPFVGMVIDNTNTKFGKNRPFIVLGQIILFAATFAIFRLVPSVSDNMRFITFIILYMVYIIGYTCQCVVTKSAQTCLTNDPEQRPIFSMFDAVYNIALMSLWYPVYLSGTLLPNFTLTSAAHADEIAALIAQNPNLANCLTESNGIQTLSGFYNPNMWTHMQLVFGSLSAVLAVFAIIGLWRKDNAKYFGLGSGQKIGFKDYADVLAHNRGIQMLVVAASTDKLATTVMSNSTLTICIFGIIFGNYALNASLSAITAVPICLISIFGIGYIARKMGQKTCLVIGTWGCILGSVGVALFFWFFAGKEMLLPTFSLTDLSTWGGLFSGSNWNLIGVLYLVLYIIWRAFMNLSGNIVIPMTADCADYEVYRSGRYVPGLMGTLFSFIDKLISSFAATLVSVVFAAVGFSQVLPTVETPLTNGILMATIICFCVCPLIGSLCNVVAMKFYPLSKEYMAEIQGEIADIKAKSVSEAA